MSSKVINRECSVGDDETSKERENYGKICPPNQSMRIMTSTSQQKILLLL